ncbi:DUF2975 domain-containing protein [Mucilaginibacter sp. SG564]|uniref:DUF2975 domain-containing protein n=1 Tax=unclassified Mucilaginibacter TaxID=2617802 RepID=UPI00155807FB|nr:DUF2975 domain-containing protein [Mucilaginibacter sp. SG564]NOW96475.1 hypothetical protein [Mucilaginibacter sp. SG564]
MKRVRVIAASLFYISRAVAIPYLATALYSLLCIVLSLPAYQVINGGRRFVINYPFTDSRFLIGDDVRFYYKFELVALLSLYGLFFWLLGNIFNTFRQSKLFTVQGVKRLQIFYILNFVVPLPFLIGHIIYSYEVNLLIALALLHAVVGIFAYFMAVIFKQGLNLQNEQDLYI